MSFRPVSGAPRRPLRHVGVIRMERTSDLHRAGFLRGAPDLAVQILSPLNAAAKIAAKVTEYLAAGSRMVWVIDPEARTVGVHEPRGEARVLRASDALAGGNLLPLLHIPVSEVFEE